MPADFVEMSGNRLPLLAMHAGIALIVITLFEPDANPLRWFNASDGSSRGLTRFSTQPAASLGVASCRRRIKSLTVSVIVRFSCSAYRRSFSISSLVMRRESLVSAGLRVLDILSAVGCTIATHLAIISLAKKGGYMTSILANGHKTNNDTQPQSLYSGFGRIRVVDYWYPCLLGTGQGRFTLSISKQESKTYEDTPNGTQLGRRSRCIAHSGCSC